jgi:hypothetical protein
MRSARRQLTKELEPLRDENRRLREDLETRLRLPSFGLEAVRLTELAAQRQIEEVEERYKRAIEEHDQQLAQSLRNQLAELGNLRSELARANDEKSRLESALRAAITHRQPARSTNGVQLLTGLILVVKHNGCYGAVQAVDQAGDKRGKFIRYFWWFQPDGSGVFTTPGVQSGYAETREGIPGVSPRLQIGPIALEWSMGGDGSGWVYFGPSSSPSRGYQLLVTSEIDISRIDASMLPLLDPIL